MMDEKKLIATAKYDLGRIVEFFVYQGKKDGRNAVSLAFTEDGGEEVWFRDILYDDAAAAYQSEYLSWYNLIFCSNSYGPVPVVKYMNRAVQDGKKIAATIYPVDANEYYSILRETNEGYYCFPYHPDEYQYLLYISKKGTLNDYFDLEAILEVYRNCGVALDEEKVREFFTWELDKFGKEKETHIQIHNCLGNEELVVTGLLFGYPVESTVALLKKDITELDRKA